MTVRRLTGPEQVLIPSHVGLRLLLRRAGFADVEVTAAGGVLRADRSPRRR